MVESVFDDVVDELFVYDLIFDVLVDVFGMLYVVFIDVLICEELEWWI